MPKILRGLALVVVGALAALTVTGAAHAQKKTLVIALNQDPDILDPTLARTYVGRIVFSHLCEKLYEIDEGLRARIAAEARSRVTFTLEPDGDLVRLTVVHDGFEPGSTVLEMVSGGWPRVIGALKTLLEAGGEDGDGFAVEAVAEATPEAVFSALTTLEGLGGWWMPDVSGSPAPGGEVTFHFDGNHVTMLVEHVEAPSLVVWRCTESTKFPEWVGTSIWFDLRARDARSTVIRFRHVGLLPSCDCYGECSGGWDHFVGSLASFAAGEGGHPRGSERWQLARSARL